MVELLNAEAEFDALGLDLRIESRAGITLALGRIEPALIARNVGDLRD